MPTPYDSGRIAPNRTEPGRTAGRIDNLIGSHGGSSPMRMWDASGCRLGVRVANATETADAVPRGTWHDGQWMESVGGRWRGANKRLDG
jgi:hypothetical protein